MKNLLPCIAVFCLAVVGVGDLMGQVVDGTLSQRFRPSRLAVPAARVARDLPVEIDHELGPVHNRYRIISPAQDDAMSKEDQDKDEMQDLGDKMEDKILELELEPLEDDDDSGPAFQPFGAWPRKGIREIRLDIRDPSNELPEDQSYQLQSSYPVSYTHLTLPTIYSV